MKLRPLSDPRYEALFGPVGASQWIGAGEWAIRRLKELGVPPPANSRLGRAPALMRTLNADQRLAKATPQRRLLAEAQWTALEFIGIARSINPRAGWLPNVLRKKLARAYGGADDPADDTDRTFVARNTVRALDSGLVDGRAEASADVRARRAGRPMVPVARYCGQAHSLTGADTQACERSGRGVSDGASRRRRGPVALRPRFARACLGVVEGHPEAAHLLQALSSQGAHRLAAQPRCGLPASYPGQPEQEQGGGHDHRKHPPKSAMPMMRAPLGFSVRSPGQERPPFLPNRAVSLPGAGA